MPTSCPPYKLVRELTVESLEASMCAKVHALLRERRVVGASLAVVRVGEDPKHEPFSYCKTFGFADLHDERGHNASAGCSAKRPKSGRASVGSVRSSEVADPRLTLFDLGSHARVLTAMGALQLWQEEALDLDRDVSEYLPPEMALGKEFPQGVTLAHLLSHTSGIAKTGAVDVLLNARAERAAAGVASGSGSPTSAAETPLGLRVRSRQAGTVRVAPPGVFHRDCTHNYDLVGSVLEHMSGLEYARFVSRSTLGAIGVATYERLRSDDGVVAGGGKGMLHHAGGFRVTLMDDAEDDAEGETSISGTEKRRPRSGDSEGSGGGVGAKSRPDPRLMREPVEAQDVRLSPTDGLCLTSAEMARLLGAMLTAVPPNDASGGSAAAFLTSSAIGRLHDSHFRWSDAKTATAVLPNIHSTGPTSRPSPNVSDAPAVNGNGSHDAVFSVDPGLKSWRAFGTGEAGDVSLGLRRRSLHWDTEAPEVVYHSSDDSSGADALLVIFPAARLGVWIATNTAEPWTLDERKLMRRSASLSVMEEENGNTAGAEGLGSGGDFGDWSAGIPALKLRRTGTNGRSPRFCEAVLAYFVDAFFPPPRVAARPELSYDLWTQLLPPLSREPLVDLYVLPFSGGTGAKDFEHWPALFPDFVQIHAVTLPGRGSRAKHQPFSNAVATADIIAGVVCSAMKLRDANAPWALFGHGLGALLAFEVARFVEARTGRSPMHVFVSGCASPNLAVNGRGISQWVAPPPPPRTSKPRMSGTVEFVDASGTGNLCGTAEAEAIIAKMNAAAAAEVKKAEAIAAAEAAQAKFASYPDHELITLLQDSPRLPRVFRKNHLMLRAMMSTIRADVIAEQTYEWDAEREPDVLSCPITAFAGKDDEEVKDSDLARWSEMTSSSCGVIRLPGDHFFLEDNRGREILTRTITTALGRDMTRHVAWLGTYIDRAAEGTGVGRIRF